MGQRLLTGTLLAAAAVGFLTVGATAQEASHNITVVLPGPPDNLEPCNMSVSYVGTVLRDNVIETLVSLNPKNSAPEAKLAESWTQVEPTRWRVVLRDGVKFQDGAAFDADAVVKSLNRVLNPALQCYDRYRLPSDITMTPQAVDSHTVDIVSSQPLPLMPIYLSIVGITSPNTDPDKIADKPVGTGPYSLVSWDQTQNIVLQPFAGYWGAKPQVQRATYVWRAESSIRANMVPAGEADISTEISPQDATDPTMDHSYLTGETTQIRIFMNAAPLNDIRVRQALNYAVDRKSMVGTIFSADVIPASQLMVPSTAGYSPNVVPYPYDPDKAKELLAAAKADGVAIDAPITLVGRVGFFPNEEEGLQAMMQMWTSVGLNVKLQMLDKVQWLKLVNKPFDRTRPATLIQEAHDNTYGDASFTTTYYYYSKSAKADETYPDLDTILEQAQPATGPARAQLFEQANEYIADKIVPSVLMFHMASYIRVSPKLTYEPSVQTNASLALGQITFN